jgi:hypothetical protein
MKYGFDHCRICGKPIAAGRADWLEQWEAAQRRPPIPETEWRKMGFLAAPTKFQLKIAPANGCCSDCGLVISHRTSRYHVRGIASILGVVAMTSFIAWVIFYMRQ